MDALFISYSAWLGTWEVVQGILIDKFGQEVNLMKMFYEVN